MARRDPILYLLCGLAFAGKSTLAALLSERTGAAIVSLDAINAERGLHGGLGIPGEEWVATHQEALRRLEALLGERRSAIVDDTCCFRRLRDSYRGLARRHGAEAVVIHLEVPFGEALRRLRENESAPRRSPVTEPILRDLLRDFEPPEADEETIVYRHPEPFDSWLDRVFPGA